VFNSRAETDVPPLKRGEGRDPDGGGGEGPLLRPVWGG